MTNTNGSEQMLSTIEVLTPRPPSASDDIQKFSHKMELHFIIFAVINTQRVNLEKVQTSSLMLP